MITAHGFTTQKAESMGGHPNRGNKAEREQYVTSHFISIVSVALTPILQILRIPALFG